MEEVGAMGVTRISYELITSDNLEEIKPLLEEGLSRIKRSHNDILTIGNVCDSIVNKQAVPLAICCEDKRIGFVMASLFGDADGVLTLRGQLAYTMPTAGVNMADEGFIGAEIMANTLGAKRIRFESMRRGWVPKAKANGYTIRNHEESEYIFTKELL